MEGHGVLQEASLGWVCTWHTHTAVMDQLRWHAHAAVTYRYVLIAAHGGRYLDTVLEQGA